jgi:hypothetical protein
MSSDQRAAFRFTVPLGQDQAVLRIGRKNISVRLINTSATGFLLACPKLAVADGDVLQLRTSAGWSEIRIAFIDANDEGCRLGVERVRDIVDARQRIDWVHLLFLPYHQIGGAGGLIIMGGLLVALLAIGAPFAAEYWPPARRFDLSPTVSGLSDRVAKALWRPAPAGGSSWQPSPTRISRVAANPTRTAAAKFAQSWRAGNAGELSARLRLSSAQIRLLNELLAARSAATAEDNANAAPFEQQLAEILTEDQVRVMKSQW